MNNKNAATMGVNRSSSIAMGMLDTDMPRHGSLSKPTTNNVSPRLGTLETSSHRYNNDK